MLLSIKTKLKLNASQRVAMSKHAGVARFTYNWGLAAWQNLYKDGLKPNKYLLKKFFNNHVKPEYEWIKEQGICQKITQYAFDQLGNAFNRFFKGQGKYPQFKKKGLHDSFTVDTSGKPISVGGTSLKLPTIGWVKTFEGLPHTNTKKLTISRVANDWFIVFAYEQPKQMTFKTVDVVGIDLGVKTVATLSTGVVFPNPRSYKKSLAKLQRLSKKHSRKQLGAHVWRGKLPPPTLLSNRRNKARLKLATCHARVANIRNDNLHKITTYLCKNHAKVVIEDLNISGMIANHKLAQSITDCGFHEFKRQLTYKAEKFGSEIILADRWYPSTKTCSNCGHIQDMPLSARVYDCGGCNRSTDRDLNAALNLSRLASSRKVALGIAAPMPPET